MGIHDDQRMITADQLTTQLTTIFPSDFSLVSQYGHAVPAYKLHLAGGAVQLLELEVFVYHSWLQCPQYNLQIASCRALNVNEHQS